MEEQLNDEIIEALGITRPVYEEITAILGRLPNIEDISTLMAMWESNGKQQSLYGWLKGMKHTHTPNNYIYNGSDQLHKQICEPRVSDCITIAHHLPPSPPATHPFLSTGHLIYMVGNVSSIFLDSDYARQYLHLADTPLSMPDHNEEISYTSMILQSLLHNSILQSLVPITHGGIFSALVASSSAHFGFDILTCREVRLDAFLFGEEQGRWLVSLPESSDDLFLLKLSDARLNCCFLGRVTKGRILVDGTDFGPISDFANAKSKP